MAPLHWRHVPTGHNDVFLSNEGAVIRIVTDFAQKITAWFHSAPSIEPAPRRAYTQTNRCFLVFPPESNLEVWQ